MIDLDKARAARLETKGQGPVITYGGKEYQLPPELPFSTLEALRGLQGGDAHAPGAIADLTRALLGDGYETVLADGFSVDDANAMMEAVIAEYGVADPLDSSES